MEKIAKRIGRFLMLFSMHIISPLVTEPRRTHAVGAYGLGRIIVAIVLVLVLVVVAVVIIIITLLIKRRQ